MNDFAINLFDPSIVPFWIKVDQEEMAMKKWFHSSQNIRIEASLPDEA